MRCGTAVPVPDSAAAAHMRDDVSSGTAAAVTPLVIVISGPSGVGKDALLVRMRERGEPFAQPVTMTTRAPRPQEIDGRDYLFVTRDAFERLIADGELLEHAEVYGNLYGVPRAQLRDALASGSDVLMRVDVQGAATLRRLLPGAVFIFLIPDVPSRLEEHLRERTYEHDDARRRRLATAEAELAARDQFDYVVTNVEGDLDGTVDRVLAIAAVERARGGRVAVVV